MLGQLLIDSKLHAPDDVGYGAFHVAFAEAATASGKEEVAREDFERALTVVTDIIERNAIRLLLPKRLRETTYLNPVQMLAEDFNRIALRQARRIRQSLESGGLWRALAQTTEKG